MQLCSVRHRRDDQAEKKNRKKCKQITPKLDIQYWFDMQSEDMRGFCMCWQIDDYGSLVDTTPCYVGNREDWSFNRSGPERIVLVAVCDRDLDNEAQPRQEEGFKMIARLPAQGVGSLTGSGFSCTFHLVSIFILPPARRGSPKNGSTVLFFWPFLWFLGSFVRLRSPSDVCSSGGRKRVQALSAG